MRITTGLSQQLSGTSLKCKLVVAICGGKLFGGSVIDDQWFLVFSVAGPSVWNSLPEYLRDPAVGRDSSGKQLKTFLFATY